MPNKFVFEGLAELKAELRNLPKTLAGEATGIVMDSASRAKAEIGAVYSAHRRSGNLAAGLTMTVLNIGPYGAAAEVRSRAKHAWLFDNGSAARHYITASGKKHDTGAMWSKSPPMHTFASAMARHRRRMYTRLRDLLERHGMTVTGQVA